jgi:hypothetical protein
MEIAFKAWLGRPIGKGDAAFVSRMTFGHPFGFFDPEAVEEPAQPRRRALAHADDADGGGLDHRDIHPLWNQARKYERRIHPAEPPPTTTMRRNVGGSAELRAERPADPAALWVYKVAVTLIADGAAAPPSPRRRPPR